MRTLLIPYSVSDTPAAVPDPTPNMRGRLLLVLPDPEADPPEGDSVYVCLKNSDGVLGWTFLVAAP